MPRVAAHLDRMSARIDCLSDCIGQLRRELLYRLQIEKAEGTDCLLNATLAISFPVDIPADSDVSIRYRPRQGVSTPFEQYLEKDISDDVAGSRLMLASVMNLEHAARLIQERSLPDFRFSVIVLQDIELSELRERGWIEVTSSQDRMRREVQVRNCCRGWRGQPITIHNYPQVIGNLDQDVIWRIRQFCEARSESWMITVNEIGPCFAPDDYECKMKEGLALQQDVAPVKRLPNFLGRHFPQSVNHSLVVSVLIPAVEPDRIYRVQATMFDATTVMYSAGVDLDRIVQKVQLELMEHLPIDPECLKHQRVLSQLLLYRQGCLTVTGYIGREVAEQGEVRGFHEHIHEKLHHQLAFGRPNIISEADVGSSRVDLLVEGVPTELKLERRKTATTAMIVDSHERQAADYIAACSAPFGFLVVLDAVLEREGVTPPPEQDVKVVHVDTAAGGTVPVVAVVVRMPSRPSDR